MLKRKELSKVTSLIFILDEL